MHGHITPSNTLHVVTRFVQSKNVSRHTVLSREIGERAAFYPMFTPKDLTRLAEFLQEAV